MLAVTVDQHIWDISHPFFKSPTLSQSKSHLKTIFFQTLRQILNDPSPPHHPHPMPVAGQVFMGSA